MRGARKTDAAGIGQAFQARGDIDAIAEDVAILDHDVADVDANSQFERSGSLAVDFTEPALNLDRTFDHLNGARNSNKKPSPMLFTRRPLRMAIAGRIRSRARCRQPPTYRFVVSHQTAIAHDVGSNDSASRRSILSRSQNRSRFQSTRQIWLKLSQDQVLSTQANVAAGGGPMLLRLLLGAHRFGRIQKAPEAGCEAAPIFFCAADTRMGCRR